MEDNKDNSPNQIIADDSPLKQKINKNENNQMNGGEAFLGVLKDEEEKKEEEMEQKMREEKEFKKFESTELEDEELKQEEDLIKDEIIKEEEKEEIEKAEVDKKQRKKSHEVILPNEVDESKKVFKINNNNDIKEIIIHNASNSPATRCYLSAEYSPKNKKIICIGGSDINSDQYNKITLYDTSNHKWSYYKEDFEAFSIKISGQSSNLVNIGCNNIDEEKRTKEKIFLFGGFNNFLEDYTSHSFIIDTTDMTFEDISYNINNEGKTCFPTPRSYHTSNYDPENQRIYVYGGTDLNVMNSKKEDFQCLWEYYLEGKYWNKHALKNCNQNGSPRGHTSILHNKKLYIFGGILLFKKFQNKLFTIDLEQKQIDNLDNKKENVVWPKPTAFHSALKINDEKFIIHGGLNENYNVINDCYLFYFNENKFEKVEIPFLPKLFGHKLNLDFEQGSIFIVGGMDSFKYIGDENLIYSDDEEEEEENDKNIKEGNIEVVTKPMEQIFEIVLNNFVCQENKDIEPVSLFKKHRKVIHNLRWLKYYI